MASRSAVVSVPVTTSAAVRTTACSYNGYSLRAGASGAVITIYDNASAASGTVLEVINISASTSVHVYYPEEKGTGGLRAVNGLYFSTNQTVTGSIRVTG